MMRKIYLTLITLILSVASFATIAPITGTTQVCAGATTTLADTTTGGTWSSSNPAIGSVGSLSGVVAGVTAGSIIITYTVGGSYVTTGVTVNPLPSRYAFSGGGAYCSGGAGVHIGLVYSSTGFSYQLYMGTSAVSSSLVGINAALDFGLYTAPGTYTAMAMDNATGCIDWMIGSVTITVDSLPALFTVIGGGHYCMGGTGVHIRLSGSQTGVLYQLFDGASPSGGAVSGTGDSIDFGLKTAAGIYTVVATNPTGCSLTMTDSVVISIASYPHSYGLSAGPFCAGVPADIKLAGSDTGVTYTLDSAGVTIATSSGTGAAIDFGFHMPATYSVIATNAYGCSITIGGGVYVVDPPPTVYTVTGSGHYCAGTSGAHIGLSGSQVGVNYRLYRGTTLVDTLIGTGTSLDFGAYTTAGAYTVVGVNATVGCTSNMSGIVTVIMDAAPTLYIITGGGSFCAGGIGVHVGLAGSSPGISYRMYVGGVAVGSALSGTGSALDFGPQTTSGVYKIIATNVSTGCTDTMSSSATITVNPLPAIDTVLGGGTYCTGGTGVHIRLSGSQTGVNYQVYRGTSSTGAPVAGTGSLLDFGLFTISGTYTIVAVNPVTGCTATMYGSVTITVVPPPTLSGLTDTGTFCSGGGGDGRLFLTSSDTGVTYTLDSAGVTILTLTGTGSSLDFGHHVLSSYSITATNRAGCTATSSGTIISITPTVTPMVSISASPGTTVVSGTTVTLNAIPVNGGTSPAYQWFVNGIPVSGATSSSYSYMPFALDSVTVCMTSDAPCASPLTVCTTVTMHVLPSTTTSTQLISANTFVNIYPNPATDELTIDVARQAFNSFIVTNDLGQQYIAQSITSAHTTVDIRTLPPGIYYISLQSDDGNVIRKFVKL